MSPHGYQSLGSTSPIELVRRSGSSWILSPLRIAFHSSLGQQSDDRWPTQNICNWGRLHQCLCEQLLVWIGLYREWTLVSLQVPINAYGYWEPTLRSCPSRTHPVPWASPPAPLKSYPQSASIALIDERCSSLIHGYSWTLIMDHVDYTFSFFSFLLPLLVVELSILATLILICILLLIILFISILVVLHLLLIIYIKVL